MLKPTAIPTYLCRDTGARRQSLPSADTGVLNSGGTHLGEIRGAAGIPASKRYAQACAGQYQRHAVTGDACRPVVRSAIDCR